MKKYLAILLCFVMMLTSCTVSYPYQGDGVSTEENEEGKGDNDPIPPEEERTPPEEVTFDFQSSGLAVQCEVYNKCKLEVQSQGSSETIIKSGKNLCGGKTGNSLPFNSNGINYTGEEDGTIICNGTATKNSLFYVSGKNGKNTSDNNRMYLPEGTYTLSGCPDGGSSTTYRLRLITVSDDKESVYYNDTGDGVVILLREATYVVVCVQVIAGYEANELKFQPQLELGNRATSYEKYSGEEYTVEIKDGVGTLQLDLPESENEKSFHTFRTTGDSLTVFGCGDLKYCLKPIWHASKAHFAIVDDDGKVEVYTKLMPLLNERNIKFSTSVVPTKLNLSGFLSVEQLNEIVEAGNKVMCHGKTHINLSIGAKTYAEKYDEIIGGKELLEQLGFEVDVMVYPNGSYDDDVLEITQIGYKCALSTGGGTRYGEQRYNEDPIDLYAIKRINIGSYYYDESDAERAKVLADAKANIDECIKNNYLCVIMTHIGDADEDGIAQIIELIDYIESKGYSIDDFDTALGAHIQPEDN